MRQKKIYLVLILSIILMATTAIISYLNKSKSQKLPAVIKSNKLYLTSSVDGTLSKYFVKNMQKVKKGEIIAKIKNPKLNFLIKSLKLEKEKYKNLILSAKSGDELKLKLLEIDDDIINKNLEIKKSNFESKTISKKINVLKIKLDNYKKIFEANKKLRNKNLISAQEFDEKTQEYLDILANYSQAKNDSLVAAKTVIDFKQAVKLQKAQKEIYKKSKTILTAKYQIELDKVNAEILTTEEDIKNLNIYSPTNGIVVNLNYLPGERVKTKEIIAEIADLSRVWVIAYGNSYSNKNAKIGNNAVIYCNNKKKLNGKVIAISPIMEKIKALSTSYETANPYTKLEIQFDDQNLALKNITPGERLLTKVIFK